MDRSLMVEEGEEAMTEPAPIQPSLGSPQFDAIYREHCKAIYYLALRMLREPARAEDATHDVFLKAFRKMEQFKGKSSVRTWLYRIAIHHCQNLLQSWHQRNVFSGQDDSSLEQATPDDEHPLRVMERKELGERIQKTLDTLPEEYRLVLLLMADQNLSYDQISSLTGQSSDAVRGKLHRARKAFITHFKKSEHP